MFLLKYSIPNMTLSKQIEVRNMNKHYKGMKCQNLIILKILTQNCQ